MSYPNKENLEAYNIYAITRSQPAPGAPADVMKRWAELRNQWTAFYNKVSGSFYVSNDDIEIARSIKNNLQQNQNPDAWQYVQETAADKPDRKAYKDRPDAPGKQAKPWEKKGLTYPKAKKPEKVPVPPTPKAETTKAEEKVETPKAGIKGMWGKVPVWAKVGGGVGLAWLGKMLIGL